MKVFYKKGVHVVIHFPAHELKQALSVLKALAQFFGGAFLLEAAKELENDLFPKLEYKSKFHLCTKCCTELHEDEDNSIRINGAWMHRTCPVLKNKRPN